MTYTVATFNMKRAFSERSKASFQNRTESIEEFFRSVSPDILGTQELTEKAIDVLEKKEHISDIYCRVGCPRTLNKKDEYTAIF